MCCAIEIYRVGRAGVGGGGGGLAILYGGVG